MAIRALVHFWECATWCVSKLHSAYPGCDAEEEDRTPLDPLGALVRRADRAGQTLVCATFQSTVPRMFIRGGETRVQHQSTHERNRNFSSTNFVQNPARKVRPTTTNVERNKETRTTRPSEKHPPFPLSCDTGEEPRAIALVPEGRVTKPYEGGHRRTRSSKSTGA